MKSAAMVLLVLFFSVAGSVRFVEAAESENAAGIEFKTQNAVVASVIDGNTVSLRFANDPNGEVRLAKMKGIVASWKGDEGACFAEDSAQYLAKVLLGREVTVEFDSGEKLTKNDYLLVYLSYEGFDINEAVLRLGHGWVAHMPADRKEKYLKLEKEASDANLGLWNSCAGKEFLKPHLPK